MEFETLYHQAWLKGIEQQKAGLQAPLLVRHPETGQLLVNLEKDVMQLIRSVLSILSSRDIMQRGQRPWQLVVNLMPLYHRLNTVPALLLLPELWHGSLTIDSTLSVNMIASSQALSCQVLSSTV